MKTTAECWRALLAEKELMHVNGYSVHLEGNKQIDNHGIEVTELFYHPEKWSIYEPSKPHEHPDAKKQLWKFWYKDEDNLNDHLGYFNSYDETNIFPYVMRGVVGGFKYARPLTKNELNELKAVAPKEIK